MLARRLRTHAVAYLFVLQLSSALSFEYWLRIDAGAYSQREQLHRSIVEGTAPYEFRYRVLIPYAAEGIRTVLPIQGRPAFDMAYLALHWCALTIFLGSLYHLVLWWSDRPHALFGICFASVLALVTFKNHHFQPWSLWEAAFYSVGLLLIQRRKYGLLPPLAAAGAAMRETTCFLPLGFVLCTAARPVAAALRGRALRLALVSGAAWLATFGAVHALVGYRPATFSVALAIGGNREFVWYSLLLNALFLGPLWPRVLRAIRNGPQPLRRFALAYVPYLGLLAVIGYWWEIRYWLSTLAVLVPALVLDSTAGARSQPEHQAASEAARTGA